MKITRGLSWPLVLAILVLYGYVVSAMGQDPVLKKAGVQANEENVVTLGLESKLAGREMPYRVILPPRYKLNPRERFPVIYLLHGLYGHYDNWTDKTGIAGYSASYKFIIVTPEGGDGWYTDSVSTPNDKYESYIVKELIPEIDKRFRTIPDRGHRAIAGLSMGGYGALKFGLKYPELFTLVGSFSGAVAGTQYTEKSSGAIAKSIDSVYGPLGSDTRKDNDIFRIVRELGPEKQKGLPFIYLDCGTEDFLFQSNRDFLFLLTEKKIQHQYRELPGVHDWRYWDQQVQEFLRVADRSFNGDLHSKKL